jgi:ATP-binding cassette, subfamily F, member 3
VIRLRDVRIQYADKVLFDGIHWHLRPGERVGLVGDNGVGKTTLLRVMNGLLEPDKGEVRLTPRIRTGTLEQDFSFSSSRPLLEVVLAAAGDLKQIELEIRELQDLLGTLPADHEDLPATLAHLGHLQEQFENRDGFRLEAEARRILQGLGFAPGQLERPLSEFSGGWQMRAAMARLLLSSPDLLLLDEPTNHLDTDALEWLERFLKAYDGTVVTVSHDRFFLDRTVTQIAEIARGRLTLYPGNWTAYRRRKEDERARLEAEAATMKERIAELERFIERFRYKASKASQVQSRIKMLEKIRPPQIDKEEGGIHFRFPPCERSGEMVLELRDLGMDYGDGPVFAGLDLQLKRGERVALVGPNGAGKSTLVRLISGLQAPTAGEARIGHKVRLDVYTQEVEDRMNRADTVLDELGRHNRGLTQTELRNLLGCFLFRGEAVFKPVGVLSGGEKSRLAVAGLLLEKSNFLVLDEPTNHLDLKAKDMLQRALAAYEGTVLVVSHDRYFLDGVVTRVLELREGHLSDRPGNYSEFLAWREEQAGEAAHSLREAARITAMEGDPESRPRSREERKRATDEKIRRGRILREAEQAAAKVEAEIARRETRMTQLEAELVKEDVYSDSEKMKRASVEYARLRETVAELYDRWEHAQQQVEETRAKLGMDP